MAGDEQGRGARQLCGSVQDTGSKLDAELFGGFGEAYVSVELLSKDSRDGVDHAVQADLPGLHPVGSPQPVGRRVGDGLDGDRSQPVPGGLLPTQVDGLGDFFSLVPGVLGVGRDQEDADSTRALAFREDLVPLVANEQVLAVEEGIDSCFAKASVEPLGPVRVQARVGEEDVVLELRVCLSHLLLQSAHVSNRGCGGRGCEYDVGNRGSTHDGVSDGLLVWLMGALTPGDGGASSPGGQRRG